MSSKGPSVTPSEEWGVVRERDGSRCVICGRLSMYIMPILPLDSSWDHETRRLMKISPQLASFSRYHPSNFMTRKLSFTVRHHNVLTQNPAPVCPNHAVHFEEGGTLFLPDPTTRQTMKTYEEKDFARRQEHVEKHGSVIPRKLPFLLTEGIQCVPFEFDPSECDDKPFAIIPFSHASAFALLHKAARFISRPRQTHIDRVDSIAAEIQLLLQLYHKEPLLPPDAESIPATSTESEVNTSNQSCPTIPKDGVELPDSVEGPIRRHLGKLPAIVGSKSNVALQDVTGVVLTAEQELDAYQHEPGISPEDLEDRKLL
ncbi:hypothetical protein FRC03_009983 [Tulasnella sp. 419]|nr:hypothetical protein FRC03_009983 [Tulasnella sp. 419]